MRRFLLTFFFILLVLLLSLLIYFDLDNSKDLEELSIEVSRLSESLYQEGSKEMTSSFDQIEESLLKAENNIEEISSQLFSLKENEITKISDSINVFLAKLDSKNSSEDLRSSITQLSSSLDEFASGYGTELSAMFKPIIADFRQDLDDVIKEMTSTQNNQESLTRNLEQIVMDLSEQLDLFSLYIQQATDGSAIAAESFMLALDDTKDYGERRYYYLNAIMHNPTEATYYYDYISFLDENNAVPDEYWTLATDMHP